MVPQTLHRLIGWLLVATILGTAGELLLVEHTEDVWQLVPLVLLGVTTLAVAVAWQRPKAITLRIVRTVMVLGITAGLLGLWLHYRANAEFELEMYPALGGWDLFWKAIHGAAPPSLAPGAMLLIGALGLIWSFSGEAQ